MRTLLPLFLTACFSVDPSRIVYRCNADTPCPQGLICQSDQICGPGSASEDLGAGDGAATDMAQTGCTVPGGEQLGRAWACPFTQLATNQASGLCAAGYRLCTNATDLQGAARCKLLNGFFAAETYSTYFGSPGQVDRAQCRVETNMFKTYFGCGKINIGVVYQQTVACMGFERAIDCEAAAAGWTCMNTLDKSSTTVAGGVLCCPM